MSVYDVPYIANYAYARRLWQQTEPWKKSRQPHARPLAARRHKGMTIRSDDEPDSPVYCRLYNTDCVTFYADGKVDIRGYPSQLTALVIRQIFGRRVIPLRMCDAYCIEGAHIVSGPDITARTVEDPANYVEVLGKADPFKFYSLDRKKVNALFKDLRWREFQTWAPTAFDLLVDDTDDRARLYAAAEEAFPEIFAEPRFDPIWLGFSTISASGWVAAIRKGIIRKNIATLRDVEELPYCEDEQEYRRKLRAHLKAT